ncbi:hypothetical protein H9L10_03615 [Phycicoccus endophyticus]|uniref:Uncharacterized protein n=1 Tax=Phycicoccus endophyticus TaxID=1690220 RepID=A0A7G9R3I2_9MICO|nr:hypothetical protein [Phycicoccus endophyticus]NHI19913.1 hypothetical protein [Phycicoccus endophyticus]QNN50157.1 hypothetical protein H9L10_03615 [Phycicoccus endophyticus]GGL27574.1 hypothetical protein GCM10012283_07200 [Phycicoccus endophyticus]
MKFQVKMTTTREQVRNADLRDQLVSQARSKALSSDVGDAESFNSEPEITITPTPDPVDSGTWYDVLVTWDGIEV